MFLKKKEHKKDNKSTHETYDVKYENLAIPEVHTEPETENDEMEEELESITYESVAIPEIHIKKKK